MNSTASKEEESRKTQGFVNALTGTTAGVKGILRVHTREDSGRRPNVPYPHQRRCAKRAIAPSTKRLLMCHDAGLGKTFTFLISVAGIHTLKGSGWPKVLLSVPASCLSQWHAAILDTLRLPSSRLLVTNRESSLTASAMRRCDVIVVSRDVISRAFRKTHERCQGGWSSSTGAHPLFDNDYDVFGIDEVHFMRNSKTAWTSGHELVAMRSERVVAMTATPLFNSLNDLSGIAKAADLDEKYKQVSSWYVGSDRKVPNLPVVRAFQAAYVDRVVDSVLDLPPLSSEVRTYPVRLEMKDAAVYNALLYASIRIRAAHARQQSATADSMRRLIGNLQALQQYAVSPLLALKGALEVQNRPDLVQEAAIANTDALKVLKEAILELNAEGHRRVMVCCCHTSMLIIAQAYLARSEQSCGQISIYKGAMTLKQRATTQRDFLTGEHAVLLMSIDAGGTGLHLVPGCNAVLFWGSRPFSPMKVLQAQKRVHRIGQAHPVKVIHLIGRGSVDEAIEALHAEKSALASAVLDLDGDLEIGCADRWRQTGRIVERCALADMNGELTCRVALAPPTAPPVQATAISAPPQQ